MKALTPEVLAERIQHVLDARMYHNTAETLAAEVADLPIFGKFRAASYPLCDEVLVVAKSFDGFFVRLETWRQGQVLVGENRSPG